MNRRVDPERRRRVVSMYSKSFSSPVDLAEEMAWLKKPPERVSSMHSLKVASNNNTIEVGEKLRRPSSTYFEFTKKQSFADLRSEKVRYMKGKARVYQKVMPAAKVSIIDRQFAVFS